MFIKRNKPTNKQPLRGFFFVLINYVYSFQSKFLVNNKLLITIFFLFLISSVFSQEIPFENLTKIYKLSIFLEAEKYSPKEFEQGKKGATAVISRSQAEAEVLNVIKSKVSERETISYSLLNNIVSQNKEAGKFLTLQDTAVSTIQKLILLQKGYTGELALSANEADRLFTMRAAIVAKVTAFSTSEGGPLFGLSEKLKNAVTQYKKLESASRGASAKQQIDSRKAGEAIDERIKKIKEEADARRKALTQTLQDEDFLTQVKKKQLEYQEALSSGDMSRAAQAQLDIQSLNRQQQTNKAMQAIDDKEKADTKPLEAERKKISDANQKLADSASLAGNNLQKLASDIEKYKSAIFQFTQDLTNFLQFIGDPNNKGKSAAGLGAKLFNSAQEANKLGASVTMPDKFSGPRPKGTTEMAQEIAQMYKSSVENTAITAETANISVNSAKIDEKSASALDRFYGRGASGASSKPSQYTGRFGSSGLVPTSKVFDYNYQTGSSYIPPVTPIKKSMGGLVKMSSFPKMSAGGPVINSVPRYNSGGIVNRSNSSSSSSSVTIETLSINYPTAPGNAREFFAQVEEIARQKGIKVMSGGRTA